MPKGKLFAAWLYARRMVFVYVAVVFGIFFAIYALYGHNWGVAGYAALLACAAGLGFAVWDFYRFCAQCIQLNNLAGHFPTSPLPPPAGLPQQQYTAIIEALEAERARLQAENEEAKRDAEEYYMLWAHQIKTPIAAMQLILQSMEGTPTKQNRAGIQAELFRINQYVDMVLQYQRLSSLNSDLLFRHHTLESLVKKAVKSCAPLFIGKKLSLQLGNITGGVATDEKWFCFVLEQLLTNAAKYTPSGAVRVYTQGSSLVIEDTGIGIPAQDVPRVFERGFTGAVGRSERSSTGIGLYLCKSILARLGFGISLSSTVGSGTQVVLQLAQNALDTE